MNTVITCKTKAVMNMTIIFVMFFLNISVNIHNIWNLWNSYDNLYPLVWVITFKISPVTGVQSTPWLWMPGNCHLLPKREDFLLYFLKNFTCTELPNVLAPARGESPWDFVHSAKFWKIFQIWKQLFFL